MVLRNDDDDDKHDDDNANDHNDIDHQDLTLYGLYLSPQEQTNLQTYRQTSKLDISFSIDTFPRGFFLFPGYMKIPPYTNVLCMSDTIEPTYRAAYGDLPSYRSDE